MRRSIVFAGLVAGIISCTKDSTAPPSPQVASVSVTPDSAVVDLFDTLRLIATPRDADGNAMDVPVTWLSQYPNTVFVSTSGKVQGLNRGTVDVTATANGVVGHSHIRVKINVNAVQLTPASSRLNVGDTLRLHAALITADGLAPDDSMVTWRSSDTTKATVTAYGLVTARTQGSVTISGQVDSAIGDAIFSIPEPVAALHLSVHTDTLRQDSVFSLTAVALGPSGDTMTSVPPTWTSSDTSIAKLSTNFFQANVGGYHAGRAIILVQAGQASDSCVVIVVRPSVASIQLAPLTDTLLSDSLVAYSATIRDSVGVVITGRTVTWTSSDTSIATVTAIGVATAHAAGKAHIRAGSDSKVDSATLVVIRPSVTTLALHPDSGRILARQSVQIVALMTDSVGDSLRRPVTWTTLASAVAQVNSSGLATGLASGAAGIMAQVDAKQDTAHLTVDTIFAHPTQVVAAESFTCVLNADGGVSCWGLNRFGDIGHLPNAISCDTNPACMGTPTGINGGLSFTSIVAGEAHMCGLVAGGQAYCWGESDYGQIGNGPTVSCGSVQCTAGPIGLNGGLTFLSLAAGEDHTCGIAADSTAWCWGANFDYQLGADSADTGAHDTPLPVYGGRKFARLALGAYHSCGITGDGTAFCWGRNGEGELGIDSTDPGVADPRVRIPTQVLGNHAFADLVAGWFHTCGRIDDGSTYCWGSNGLGMLGNGTTTAAWLPVLIPNGWHFSSLAAGHWTTCGILSTGSSFCWGNNDNGQLGTGTVGGQSNSPTSMTGGASFRMLSLGGEHSCGIQAGGTVHCWGDNGVGQMGIGPVTAAVGVPSAVIGQP